MSLNRNYVLEIPQPENPNQRNVYLEHSTEKGKHLVGHVINFQDKVWKIVAIGDCIDSQQSVYHVTLEITDIPYPLTLKVQRQLNGAN